MEDGDVTLLQPCLAPSNGNVQEVAHHLGCVVHSSHMHGRCCCHVAALGERSVKECSELKIKDGELSANGVRWRRNYNMEC